MDNIIGTLIYKITGDTTALITNMERSRAQITKTGTAIEQLGTKLRKVSTTVISAVFIKSLMEAASRAEELENKFNTVFKGIETEADAWTKTYAEATSRGIIATKEFLATQQDLRTGYGDTIEQAAKYSQAVVGITNDLASFSNVPVAEAMASMQSGLAYQFEALRRLGVSLSVETINQGEYAKAINKTWLEMSNLEKQEAVLSGIVSQSKNALHQEIQLWSDYNYKLGDAALTSDSFANTSQGLLQTLVDLKAELGDALIPAATDLLGIALDLANGFNGLDDDTQTLIVSLGVLAAAIVAIGGPVGVVVGAIGAFTVGMSNAENTSARLSTAVGALSSTSGEYAQITKQLTTDTSNLTSQELALLEARKQVLGLQAVQQMKEVSTLLKDQTDKIATTRSQYAAAAGAFDAYSLALEQGVGGVSAALDALDGATLDAQGMAYKRALEQAKVILNNTHLTGEQIAQELQRWQVQYAKTMQTSEASIAQAMEPHQQAVIAIAQAYNVGAISLETWRLTDKALYDEIMVMADKLKVNTSEVSANTEATKKASYASREWRTQLAELKADQAEQAGDFKQASVLRSVLLREEQEAAIRKLSTDAGLIKSDEDVNSMSITALRNRIKENQTANQELLALDEVYSKKKKQIAQDRVDSERDLENEIATSIRSQEAIRQQAIASDLESSGYIQAAYTIRLQVLRQERAAEREILAQQVADRKATQEELDAFDKVSDAQEVALEEEKNRKLAAARKSSADATEQAVLTQENAIKEALASELESNGHIEAAYQKRIEVLQATRAAERVELEKKVADNRATNDDLIAYDRITAEQEIELEREKNQELSNARKETAKEMKKMLEEQRSSILERQASDLEDVGSFKAATDIRIGLLHTERDEAIKSMKQKVANHTATQKEMDDLSKYYANEEEKLHKEQAEKVKDFWLEALDEVANFATDLTSALSDLWSAQTEAQLEEIDRQMEAQLEALGIAEETEMETLQREYDEAVKTGDAETAQEKAEAIERLRIEEEADEKKKKLQREQAERERNIKIFQAVIDTAAAVIRYLADPGGWAGVALSASAATTGALQIAAISAEPLPSFAVGVSEVPEDMIAQIHRGEMIVPKTYAQSVRDGDVSIGGGTSNVQITIINNTSAEVSTEETSTVDDEREIQITIGKVVEKQISAGRYDSSLASRFGLRRVGRNA